MNKAYIGQTRVSIKTRIKHHRSDVESKKVDSEISGISKHARYCIHGKINWDLKVEKEKNKFSLKKISFGIEKHLSVFNSLMTHNS